MERRFFIKNVLGAIIGIAALPKLLTETISAFPISEITINQIIYLDLSSFRVGDILRINDGNCFILTMGESIQSKTFIARNILVGVNPQYLELRHKDKVVSSKLIPIATAYNG